MHLQRTAGNAAVAQLVADAADVDTAEPDTAGPETAVPENADPDTAEADANDAEAAEANLPPEMTAPYTPGPMAKAYWEATPEVRARVNAATDERFADLTGITRKLNFDDPHDKPAARMWLRLRDEEMTHPNVAVEIGPVEITADEPPAAGAPGPTFANPKIQAVYEANGSTGSANQLAALRILDTPRTGPWRYLNWDEVAVGAARRIYHPELIDQNVLGVCGPAAALEGEAATQAVGYATEVALVFETGKVGGKKVNDELLARVPGSLEQSDWMMLTAIQDTSNYVLDYHGESGDTWRAGLTAGQIESTLEHVSGAVKTEKYSCEWWGVMDQTVTVNGIMSTYGDDVVVVMLVDSDLMVGKKAKHMDHAIRLTAPAKIADGKVTINIFTWGANYTYTYDEATFKKLVYGYVVGARKDTVALP